MTVRHKKSALATSVTSETGDDGEEVGFVTGVMSTDKKKVKRLSGRIRTIGEAGTMARLHGIIKSGTVRRESMSAGKMGTVSRRRIIIIVAMKEFVLFKNAELIERSGMRRNRSTGLDCLDDPSFRLNDKKRFCR